MWILIKIILWISLAFNVALYFGWIDVGQYRNYVDKWIQTSKDIIQSPEFQTALTSAGDKLKQAYGKDLEQAQLQIKAQIRTQGEAKAREYIKKNFSGLNDTEITALLESSAMLTGTNK